MSQKVVRCDFGSSIFNRLFRSRRNQKSFPSTCDCWLYITRGIYMECRLHNSSLYANLYNLSIEINWALRFSFNCGTILSSAMMAPTRHAIWSTSVSNDILIITLSWITDWIIDELAGEPFCRAMRNVRQLERNCRVEVEETASIYRNETYI